MFTSTACQVCSPRLKVREEILKVKGTKSLAEVCTDPAYDRRQAGYRNATFLSGDIKIRQKVNKQIGTKARVLFLPPLPICLS